MPCVADLFDGQAVDGFGVGFQVVVGQVVEADQAQVVEQFVVGVVAQGKAADDIGFGLFQLGFGRAFGDKLLDAAWVSASEALVFFFWVE